MSATKKIPADVLGVLASMEIGLPPAVAGSPWDYVARITEGQLPRDLYVALDKVLKAMGGKWDRRAGGHTFDNDPSEAIELASLTGEYTDKKQALQFFETPEALAEELVAAAEIKNEHRVLEPSAGRGRIVRAINAAAPQAHVIAIEIDYENFNRLSCDTSLRADCMQANFMDVNCGRAHGGLLPIDRVVANPPFAKRQDVDHVTRAFSMLRSGGRLVSVVSGSALHRIDKKGEVFKALVKQCGRSYDLPEGTFKESGTMVRASVVVLDKE